MIENGEGEDDGNGEENEQQEEQEQTAPTVWFLKLKPLIDQVREVSFSLIFTFGAVISLDEIMIRFMGHSIETHRIENKPIGKGYEYFVLATKDGFGMNFTPDGRTAAKKNKQVYSHLIGQGKIEAMILHVVESIERFKKNKRVD